MLIMRRRGWELPESAATPEALALGRRAVLAGSAALGLGGPALVPRTALAADAGGAAPRNPKYDGGRPLSAEKDATTYNNYYEFSEQKDLWEAAQALPQRPWTIKLDGMVKQPRTITSTICSSRSRWRSGSTGIAAWRPGR